jgi:hypothetical protein
MLLVNPRIATLWLGYCLSTNVGAAKPFGVSAIDGGPGGSRTLGVIVAKQKATVRSSRREWRKAWDYKASPPAEQ